MKLTKILKEYKQFIIAALFFSILGTGVTFALPYVPSDNQLDPACAPGAVDCYVDLTPFQVGDTDGSGNGTYINVDDSTQIITFFSEASGVSDNANTPGTSKQIFKLDAADTTGGSANNFYVGFQAGDQATAGFSNFIGFNAGMQATTASVANAFGYRAGYQATGITGANLIGPNAGRTSTNATYVNFIGYQAGETSTSAGYSNFIGFQAGKGSTNVTNSIFIGRLSGLNTNGANNSIFIGYNAGSSDTVNNSSSGTSIVIGQNAATGGFSNSIALGRGVQNSAVQQLNIGNVLYATGIYNSDTRSSSPISGGRLGIGVNAPTATLDILGESLTGSSATSALNIAQTWNTTGTPTAIKLNVTDTASNASSLLLDLQTSGVSKFKVDKSGNVTSSSWSANNNVFSIGDVANNNLGTKIVVNDSNQTIAMGDTDYWGGLGTSFVIDDQNAQAYLIRGGITSPQSGSVRLAIGTSTPTAELDVLGSEKIRPTLTPGGTSTFYASSIEPTFTTSTGTDTLNTLQVTPTINQTGSSSGITRGLYLNPTLTATVDYRSIESTAGRIQFTTDLASTYNTTIFNDGNNDNRWGLLIQAGADTPSANKWIQFNDGDGTDQGSVCYTGGQANICAPSDSRLKQNIQDTTLSLSILNSIKVKDFSYISDPNNTTIHGFIAQELNEVYPNAVSIPQDPNEYWKVSYNQLTPLIVKSIQELSSNLTSLDPMKPNSLAYLIKEYLADAMNGLEKLFVKTVVTEGVQTKDTITGEVYCIVVTNGQLNHILGECGSPEEEQIVVPAPQPETNPEPIIEDNTNEEDVVDEEPSFEPEEIVEEIPIEVIETIEESTE